MDNFADKINIHVQAQIKNEHNMEFIIAEWFATKIREAINATAQNELQKMTKEATQELVRIQRAKAERARRMQKAQAAWKKYTPRKKLTDPVSVAKKK